jgi:hypothetical protein
MQGTLADDGGNGATVMTDWQVIRWWELRRLLYNAILLVIGIAAISGMEFLMDKVIPSGEDAVELSQVVLTHHTDAIALKVKHEFATKEKARSAAKIEPKPAPKALKKSA